MVQVRILLRVRESEAHHASLQPWVAQLVEASSRRGPFVRGKPFSPY